MTLQLVPVNLPCYSILNLHKRLGIQVAKFEISYSSLLNQYLRNAGWTILEGAGYRSTSDLEKRTALALTAYGLMPPFVQQERPFGRFRADFAIPSWKSVIEVDGIHHLVPDVASKDVRKEAYIKGLGWSLYRVDCRDGVKAKERIGERIGEIVDAMLEEQGLALDGQCYLQPCEIEMQADIERMNVFSESLRLNQ